MRPLLLWLVGIAFGVPCVIIGLGTLGRIGWTLLKIGWNTRWP